MRQVGSTLAVYSIVLASCTQAPLSETSQKTVIPATDEASSDQKGQEDLPSEPFPPSIPKVSEKREDSFVAAKATKNLDLVITVETNSTALELEKIHSFLTLLAARTSSSGRDVRRLYNGNVPLSTFPDAFNHYQATPGIEFSIGSALPFVSDALVARDQRVTPRPDSQLVLVFVSAGETNPTRIDRDENGSEKRVYPNVAFPDETLAFGLLKLNQPDPQVACGSKTSAFEASIVKKYNGRSFDLCDADMEAAAGFMAAAMSYYNRLFILKSDADFKQPLQVYINDQLIDPKQYAIREFGNAVEFPATFEFAAGDKVKVAYVAK